jgi:hypothetical protein
MFGSDWKARLPGYVATGLAVLATSLWTLWSMGEMYYEAWGTSYPGPLAYLTPAAVFLVFTLVVLTWPRFGGWLIIVIGVIFTAWWWRLAAGRGWLSWKWILATAPASSLLIVTGTLFLLEGRRRLRVRAEGEVSSGGWLRRNARYLIAVGLPLLTAITISIYWLPIVLTRLDDGDRGARLIEGDGVALVWAPEGPGWNWRQSWGGYPSWNQIALYGVVPVGLEDKPGYEDRDATADDMEITGLCRYLGEDGLTLMTEPRNIWRMPTADEIVRSLVRDGEHADCTWDGESQSAICKVTPDKETPLWIPGQLPIYYWAADEYGEHEAWYIPYTGGHPMGGPISHQPKSWGNPRHGYRCVREP